MKEIADVLATIDESRAALLAAQNAFLEKLLAHLDYVYRSVMCHGFLAGASPSLTAIFTRSASESAFIFCMTLPRWAFTVISVMPSFNPICLFSIPATTQRRISCSRGVSDS